MTVIEAFSKNVKQVLKQKGMTQIALSQKSDISTHTISGVMRKHHGPSLYTAYALARALEVSLDELTEGADE